MTIYFRLFDWEIELMAWAWLRPRPLVGGFFSRMLWLDAIPTLGWPRMPINTAYAEAYCPVGGIAVEVWKMAGEEDDNE